MTRTFVSALRAALALLIASTAVFAVASPASATGCVTGTQSGDYCYTTDGTTATIVGYMGADSDLTIPGTLAGFPVTTIGEAAFAYNTLTSVTIPDSVTTIDTEAFVFGTLESVTFGSSVTTIAYRAFANNSLESIDLPDSLITIGDAAFATNAITSVVIPDLVTIIGMSAFTSNAITSVTLGNSVTTIGRSAFLYNSIAHLTMGSSVTTINSGAFYDNALTSLVIPASVSTLAWDAFGKNPLATVAMDGNQPTTLGGDVFGVVPTVADPLVTFHAGATYTHGTAGHWNAGGTSYRVQEVASVSYSNPLGTAPAATTAIVGGTDLADPGNLTATGYRFDGWYNGTTAVTFPYAITADTTLTAHWTALAMTTPGTSAAGGSITVTGDGFEPGESVRIELHSDPVLLATVLAGSLGSFSTSVTIPTGTAAGEHEIFLVGTTTAWMSQAFTVSAATTTGGTTAANTTGTTATSATSGNLAATGTDPTLLVLAAFGMVGLGVLLRRRAAK